MAYTLPNTILNGTTADAGQVEANFLALLSAANNSLAADGTIGPTAAIPWNNQSLTGVGAFSAASAAISGALSAGATTLGNTTVGGTLGVTGTLTGAGASFSAGVTALSFSVDATYVLSLSSGNPLLQFDTGDFVNYDRTGNGFTFAIANVQKMNLNTGGLSVAGTLTTGGAASLGGAVTGLSFQTSGLGSTIGYVGLNPGDSTHTGYVTFFNAAGTRQGYIGFATTGGTLNVASDTGAGVAFTSGPVTMAGTLTVSGALSAPTVSATTNGISVPANQYYTMASGVGVRYNSSTSKIEFVSGGTLVASLDASGNLICKGNMTGAGTP